MAKLIADKSSSISQIEQVWLNGSVDGTEVEIHAYLFRCDGGQWDGKFTATAHLHRRGSRGGMETYRGPVNPDKVKWHASRKEAIDAVVTDLEAKDEHKVQ